MINFDYIRSGSFLTSGSWLALLIRRLIRPAVRAEAIRALGRRRPTDPQLSCVLSRELKSKHPLVREAAAQCLGVVGGRQALESLTAALGDEDKGVALAALGSIRILDPQCLRLDLDSPVLQVCIETLGSTDAARQKIAAEVLGDMASPRAAAPLIHYLGLQFGTQAGRPLTEKKHQALLAAIESLGRIGSLEAVEQLVTICPLPEAYWTAATKALESMDPDWTGAEGARKAVPVLIDLIKRQQSGDFPGRWPIVGRVVGRILAAMSEQEREPFINDLIALLSQGSSIVRCKALWALGESRDLRALEPVIRVLRGDDLGEAPLEIRRFERFARTVYCDDLTVATQALVNMGQVAVEPLTSLLDVVDNPSLYSRYLFDVIVSLERLGWRPANKTHRVLKALAERDWSAAVAIGPSATAPMVAMLETYGRLLLKDLTGNMNRVEYQHPRAAEVVARFARDALKALNRKLSKEAGSFPVEDLRIWANRESPRIGLYGGTGLNTRTLIDYEPTKRLAAAELLRRSST